MTRRTANIPEGQRQTKQVKLRLDPQAVQVLETVPSGKRSEYVGDLIVDDGLERGVLGNYWGTQESDEGQIAKTAQNKEKKADTK